ncbi:hypothetical protein [Pseudophaeobacter leonis]|uniref:hypothetical protein n=1 Tax=Pseudophaeobacter leonis TaxID=1144477 RepID=UPI001F4D4CCC|nr:hypothetical protein [Pseudophaeobacter leonis]
MRNPPDWQNGSVQRSMPTRNGLIRRIWSIGTTVKEGSVRAAIVDAELLHRRNAAPV